MKQIIQTISFLAIATAAAGEGALSPNDEATLKKNDTVIEKNEKNIKVNPVAKPLKKSQIKLQRNIRGKQIKRLKNQEKRSN